MDKEKIEYVIANLSEKEISDLAMFTLQKTEVKNADILNAYASLKAGIYERKLQCEAKLEQNKLSAKGIFD